MNEYSSKSGAESSSGDLRSRADARANRTRVLEAARAVFAEKGGAAEVKDIADRAGVGVGTIYRGFGSKEDLLRATALEAFREMEIALNAIDAEPDSREALRLFIVSAVEFVAQYGWLVRGWLSGEGPAKPHRSDEPEERFHHLRRLIRRGTGSGVFPDTISVDVLVTIIKGTVLSLTFAPPDLQPEPSPSASEIADGIVEMLCGRDQRPPAPRGEEVLT